MKKIIFWQNLVAIHQSEFIKELSKDFDVYLIVDELMSKDRLDQGWAIPDMGRCKFIVLNDLNIETLANISTKDSLHVLSPRGCKGSKFFFKNIKKQKVRYCFLTEMPMDEYGHPLMIMKKLYYSIGKFTSWRSCDFTLAMGDMGAKWFSSIGFKKVYPFGYTVSESSNQCSNVPGNVYNFVCVAQAIPRKDPKTILNALSLVECSWHFTYIGQGPILTEIKKFAEILGLSNKITWVESASNLEARKIISTSDTLILSSIFDGWGAVVNEAIAEGTRVIISNHVGSKCLLKLGDIGDVFETRNHVMLSAFLKNHIKKGQVSIKERMNRRDKHNKINGKSFSSYFINIMNGVKTRPPWDINDNFE